MQFKLNLIMAVLATSTNAFLIPEDQPNGVYAVSFMGDEHTFRLLDSEEALKPQEIVSARHEVASERSISNSRILGKRESTTCAHRYMSGDDYEVAQACLIRFADAGGVAPGNEHVYCKYNSAVSALCNYASYTQPVKHDEISTLNQRIDSICGGRYETGWWETPWTKTYVRDSSGAPLC